jgi:hypothetical protein
MCGDAVKSVVNAVVEPVKSAVSSVSNGANNVLDQASRGDIGQAVGNYAGSVAQIAKSPIEIAYDVSRGDIQHAGQTALRGVGAAGNVASGGALYLASTDAGSKVLTNPYADKLTFGITKDYYGTAMGAQQAYSSGRVDQQYWNDASRLGLKVGAIAGGVAVAGGLPTASQGRSLYAAAQSAAKGDYVGAVTGIGGSGYFNTPSFDLPKFEVPDWMNDVSKYLPSGGGSSSPSAYPESSTSPYAGAGTSSVGSSGSGAMLALAAAAVVGVIVAKKVL